MGGEIATIDISALSGPPGQARNDTVAAIMRACQDIGFLSITGTAVPAKSVDDMRTMVMALFDIDEREKWRQAITRENYRGYIPRGFFTPNDGEGVADRYEGYKLHWEADADAAVRRECRLYGPNIWPDHLPSARAVTLAYWAEMDRLAMALMTAMEEGLGFGPGALTDGFHEPLTNMTLLHYPPQRPEEKGFGIHPHKDTDALTIIAPDPVGGLEVLTRDGAWLEVACPPGGFIVNIGDMLELASGGRLVSTPHRVINRSGRQRYSFPYFAVPRHDVVVQPLLPPLPGYHREPVHCGDWSVEVWRTNWPDEKATGDMDVGSLPR